MLTGNSMIAVPFANIAKYGVSVMRFKWLALWNNFFLHKLQ